MGYILGIIAGVVTAFAVLALVILLIRKKTHKKGFRPDYDERQQAARERGYKYAFFTMLILIGAALGWYNAVSDTGSVFPLPQVLLGIMLTGVLVYASFAIWTDAYIALNETFLSSVILMACIAAVNLVLGLVDLDTGMTYINLSVGAMLAVICLEMIAKKLYDKTRHDSDAE